MEKIFKEFIAEIKDIDKKARTLVAYVSTGKKDRMGEYIPPGEWILANYRKNPVVLWAHDYRSPPVGKALWIRTDEKGLLAKIRFAETEKGEEIFYLYSEGYLNAFSVGFRAKRDEKDPNIFRKCELMENSCIPVPANAEALTERDIEFMNALKKEEITEVSHETAELIIKSAEEREEKDEETETHIHIRVRPPGKFTPGSFRVIDISKAQGIQATIGRLKGETTTTVQKYMFLKAKGWTMAKAKAWVKEHGKGLELHNNMLFGEIFNSRWEAAGKSEETTSSMDPAETERESQEANERLLEEIGRLKAGRILSAKSRKAVKAAIDALQALLDASEPAQEPSKPKKDTGTLDKPRKGVILYNKANKGEPEISGDTVHSLVKAIKGIDVKEIVAGEIRRRQGKL